MSASLAAAGAAMVTTLASIIVFVYQHRATRRDEHNLRVFDRHLPQYERIFVTARSTLDAIRDYAIVTQRAADRSDPFLSQLLSIVSHSARQYCVAVDWKHSSAMAYLDIDLEERCLHARDLLILWLSQRRVTYGDTASIRHVDTLSPIPLPDITRLHLGDYRELIIERRMVVNPAAGDLRLIADINQSLSNVIRELKKVMAY
ncbi:hypothetical protein [Streptomyces phaeochromogenes]|uniref:hypothetical protein n=1 Tax=Streptomyces phaeochromogenes TaxID=1923 RepID=UPI0027D8886D|nr:hypothetical protein [Streptomyces phaeochromogenes]